MRKRITVFVMAAALALGLLSGCAGSTATEGESDKISIIATSFAPYDLARQVAGDKASVTMLLPPGSESHSYEPTPQDVIKINKCDIFIYVGGDSDAWMTSILSSIDTAKVKIITLMDCVELLEEEIKEGMTHEHDHEDEDHDEDHEDHEDEDHEDEDHEDEHHEDEDHEHEYDEHVWTSPRNAIKIVDKITAALKEADADNADAYAASAAAYTTKLTQLDGEFEDVVAKAARKTMIFGDRFPLRYFVSAYGLDYFAAFPGCATDTEASAATVAFLIGKVKAEKIPVVFTIELSNGKIADTICEDTGAKKLQWNSCHNVTADQFKAGATYYELMKENVSLLKEALN